MSNTSLYPSSAWGGSLLPGVGMGGRSNGHFQMRQKPTASPRERQFCLTGGEDIPLDICIHSESVSASWKGANIMFPTVSSPLSAWPWVMSGWVCLLWFSSAVETVENSLPSCPLQYPLGGGYRVVQSGCTLRLQRPAGAAATGRLSLRHRLRSLGLPGLWHGLRVWLRIPRRGKHLSQHYS